MPHLLHKVYVIDRIVLSSLPKQFLIEQGCRQVLLAIQHFVRVINHNLLEQISNRIDFLTSCRDVLLIKAVNHRQKACGSSLILILCRCRRCLIKLLTGDQIILMISRTAERGSTMTSTDVTSGSRGICV